MATEKYIVGAIATLLSTELNSLANNSLAIGAAYNNVQAGGGGDGYTLCDLELVVTFGTAPTANTGVSLWLLAAPDGTNYEDGVDGTTTPARTPDVVFPIRVITTTQRITRRVWLPWGIVRPLAKNDGSGVAMVMTGNTIRIRPVSSAGV